MTDSGSDAQLERILVAIETIETSIGILARHQTIDRNRYESDSDIRDVVERRFVKATEAAIDVGRVLVSEERGTPPESNPATMRDLSAIGVLTPETAEAMAQAARFRNVLAYTYGDGIDNQVVYDALHDLDRYRNFVHEIRDYFGRRGVLED